tara:strand:- start:123 stop:344 length:222 start_codon:yes stop_codon:yes gene_type:complete
MPDDDLTALKAKVDEIHGALLGDRLQGRSGLIGRVEALEQHREKEGKRLAVFGTAAAVVGGALSFVAGLFGWR